MTPPDSSIGTPFALPATAMAIQLLIPLVPGLREAFHATSLQAEDLLLVTALALAPAVVADLLRRSGLMSLA